MSTFPSIPGWDGIHPVMVQFTVVLFCLAPVLLVVSLFSRRAWQTWAGAALLVMALGTLASWLAVASGHAAGQLVDKTPLLQREVALHEALGVQTRNVFTLFTVAFGLAFYLPRWLKKTLPTPARIALYCAVLVAGFLLALPMTRAASQGGRLVHEYGVRAMVVRAQPVAAQEPVEPTRAKPQTPPPPAAP